MREKEREKEKGQCLNITVSAQTGNQRLHDYLVVDTGLIKVSPIEVIGVDGNGKRKKEEEKRYKK